MEIEKWYKTDKLSTVKEVRQSLFMYLAKNNIVFSAISRNPEHLEIIISENGTRIEVNPDPDLDFVQQNNGYLVCITPEEWDFIEYQIIKDGPGVKDILKVLT